VSHRTEHAVCFGIFVVKRAATFSICRQNVESATATRFVELAMYHERPARSQWLRRPQAAQRVGVRTTSSFLITAERTISAPQIAPGIA